MHSQQLDSQPGVYFIWEICHTILHKTSILMSLTCHLQQEMVFLFQISEITHLYFGNLNDISQLNKVYKPCALVYYQTVALSEYDSSKFSHRKTVNTMIFEILHLVFFWFDNVCDFTSLCFRQVHEVTYLNVDIWYCCANQNIYAGTFPPSMSSIWTKIKVRQTFLYY